MSRRMLSLLIPAALAAGAAAPAGASPDVGAAAGGTISVPAELGSHLTRAKAKTTVPIRVPSRLRVYVTPSRVRSSASASRNRYEFIIGIGRGCNGANVCLIAYMAGERGGEPSFRTRVRLTQNRRGYFKPLTCGASCSPAMIEWVQRGVLYSVQYKGAGSAAQERATMIALANSAIKAGPR